MFYKTSAGFSDHVVIAGKRIGAVHKVLQRIAVNIVVDHLLETSPERERRAGVAPGTDIGVI